MPRNLATAIIDIGFPAQDVRDIGLCGHPDTEVMQTAIANVLARSPVAGYL